MIDFTPTKDTINMYTFALCPYCKPVEYLLKANGINFVKHELDLKRGDHLCEEYKKINPHQKVPAIIENDFILWESNTIDRYICNSRNVADRWYPKDPQKRALVDLYFDWHASNASNISKFTYAKIGWYKNLTLEEAKAVSDSVLKTIEELYLSKSKFITSNEVSIADLALAWHMKGLQSVDYEFSPRVTEYFNDLIQSEPGLVESFEEYLEERKKVLGI